MALNIERARTSRSTRVWIALRVAAAGFLFVVATLLVTWLAERSGLRLRFDWTRQSENTLDPATLAALGSLPEALEADVFFRPAEFPLSEVVREAQQRMQRLLVLVRDGLPGRLLLHEHDLSDVRGGNAESSARLLELGQREVEPGGFVVISAGKRRELLRVRGELADFDPGDPTGRGGRREPARLVSFRGEEALVGAALKLSQGGSPKLVFARGHGELDPSQPDVGGLAELRRALEGDGFVCVDWNGESSGPLPLDASVLALIGPEQPLSAAEQTEIVRFVESGGRLVCAPGFDDLTGEGSLAALLARWGIRLRLPGVVARPIASASGEQQFGIPQCADLVLGKAQMPISAVTDSLRRGNRRVVLRFTRALEVAKAPHGGSLLPLLSSSDDAWLELPDPALSTRYDWQPAQGDLPQRYLVGALALFPPTQSSATGRKIGTDERPEARVLVLGSSSAFANELFATNRDLLLNAFNWAASREYRAHVRSREPAARRLDLSSGTTLSRLSLACTILIPLACLLFGLGMAWRRRR